MEYIDGYVVAVPAAKQDDYLKAAPTMAQVFKECGATRVVENWGDERLHPYNNPMPFDGSRMVFGGFQTILDL